MCYSLFNFLINVNNSLILNFYLAFLTKPSISVLLLLFIYLLIVCLYLNKNLSLHILTAITIKHSLRGTINVPLSNTLFLLHPIFFFFLWIFIFFNLIRSFFKNFNICVYLYLYLVLFLGGYWSMQEFNWGGWWNWDILEIFSLLLATIFITLSHIKLFKNFIIFYSFILVFFITITSYYFLNKLGLNASIHSFVKTDKFSNNIHLFLFLFFIFYFFCKRYILFMFYYSLFLVLFFFFKNFFFLKNIIIYLCAYYLYFSKVKLKRINSVVHKFIYLFFIIIFLFNYSNQSFIYLYYYFYNNNIIYLSNNKVLLFTFYQNNNYYYYYNNFLFFKILNVSINNFWLFFTKKIFLHKFSGLCFF